MRAVAFGRGEWAEEIAAVNGPLLVSFAPVINSFRGFEKVELRLIDWKSAEQAARPAIPQSNTAAAS